MGERVVHFEFPVDDPDRATRFYSNVFDWKIEKWDGGEPYWLITTGPEGEQGINGGFGMRSEGMSRVVNTVGVTDLDKSVAKVTANGGKIVAPKMAIPTMGWLAYCTDTEGNMFGMMQPDPSAR